MSTLWPWVGFTVFVLAMLAIDLGIFNRKSHEIKPKEAGIWVAVWIALAAIFNAGVYHVLGFEKGLQFTTGYLIEEMLSVDNMFVFVLIIAAFKVPPKYQHKLLFYGILGALVMRGSLIAVGTWLVTNFHWIFYAFGAFLIFTAFKMVLDANQEVEPEKNPVIVFLSRHMPITHELHESKFFIQRQVNGVLQRAATPLFLALVCIEVTDLIFAMDSIPAVFAVTQDPFIVYTSNVFAILGLRSLYFLLSHALTKFHLLKYGVALILCFVGIKMLTKDVVEMPLVWSLVVIGIIIAGAVGLSLIVRPIDKDAADQR